jgi:PAS domain S-box-containing protein
VFRRICGLEDTGAIVVESRHYATMSKEDLLAEIRLVQGFAGSDKPLVDLVHELRVHQEEIRAQRAQLIEAQQALETSRDRYADLYDFAPIAFATLDRAGVICEANLATAALLDVERARLVGFPMLMYVAEPDRHTFLDHLDRCRGSADVVQTTLKLRNKSGTEILVSLVARLAQRSGAEPTWYTGVFDLTASERAEIDRRAMEVERLRLVHEEESLRAAAASKDRFLAMLSHELRTPLTPILFTLGSLEARDAVPPELREPIAIVRRNVQLEARLIDDLLDTTRIASGKLHIDYDVVDVHELLQNVVESSMTEARDAGIALELDLRARRYHVRGDGLRLRQVFWNLLGNSFRHTPRGGSIRVSSSNQRPGCLRVLVTDDGSGIEPRLLPRIFEPFEQGGGATRSGLGLGLAIARGVIQAHHGKIEAHSDGVGCGTTIEVQIDTVASSKRADAERSSRPVPAPGLRILLVEDHHDSAVSLCEILTLYGHTATIAESFSEALQHRGGAFDLLITDIGLPDGNGLDLLRELKLEGGRSIALSGFGSERDLRAARDAGFDLHLTKPVDVDTLVQAINSLANDELAGGHEDLPPPGLRHPSTAVSRVYPRRR